MHACIVIAFSANTQIETKKDFLHKYQKMSWLKNTIQWKGRLQFGICLLISFSNDEVVEPSKPTIFVNISMFSAIQISRNSSFYKRFARQKYTGEYNTQ